MAREAAYQALQDECECHKAKGRQGLIQRRGWPWWVVLPMICASAAFAYLSRGVDASQRALRDHTKLVRFEKNEIFSGPSSQKANVAWASMMPGQGFIRVDETSAMAHPGIPIKNTTGQLYDISAFHQLHCLIKIREYLWTMKLAIDLGKTAEAKEAVLAPREDHVLHCFDYLRQGVMCAADSTLEWPRQEEDGRRFAVDGWGVEHQCADWDALFKYAEDNAWPKVL